MATDINSFNAVTQGTYVYPILVMMTASVTVQIPVLIMTLQKLLFKTPMTKSTTHSSKSLHWFPRYLSLFTIIGFSVCNISQLAALILYLFDINFLVGWFTGDSYVWFVGKYIMYPLFCGRLWLTFKNTPYQYKWYHYGFMLCIALLLIQLIGNLFWNYYWAINNMKLVLIWSIILYSTDPLYSVIITYMFISRLAQLKSDISKAGQNQIRLSNENLIRIMSKYTILVFFGVASTSIGIILSCLRWYYVNAQWMWISAIAVSYDCLISSICILFCFPFSNKLYNKYCGLCDSIMKAKYSQNSVQRNLSEHIDDHENMKKMERRKIDENNGQNVDKHSKEKIINVNMMSPPCLTPKDSTTTTGSHVSGHSTLSPSSVQSPHSAHSSSITISTFNGN